MFVTGYYFPEYFTAGFFLEVDFFKKEMRAIPNNIYENFKKVDKKIPANSQSVEHTLYHYIFSFLSKP